MEEEGVATDKERGEEGGREENRLLRKREWKARERQLVVTGRPSSEIRVRSVSWSL